MIKSIFLTVALLISILLSGQNHNVSIIRSLSSPEPDICLALLPDSTMLISSYSRGRCQCHLMALKDTTWVKINSPLADMINALMPTSESEPYFRFSDDFTHIVVTIQENGPNRYYESVLVNGEWSLFTQIDLDPKLTIWHGVAISSDYSKLYGRSKDGGLYQFSREGESWSGGTRLTVFDQVTQGKEIVEDVLTIGNNGLVSRVDFESGKADTKAFQKKYGTKGAQLSAYFFTRLQSNQKWTAPIVVSDIHPLADNLVITPRADWLLFAIGDFGKMPLPKLLQNEIISSRKISVRERDRPVSVNAEQQPNLSRMETGKYYALLIGNADYRIHKLGLTKPPVDVKALSEILQSHYQFEKQNVLQLINADRNSIFASLQELRKKVTRSDNVLIFYAGHGYWDDAVKQGYWWPIDASPDNAANWLSNSDLREQISGINSGHTLLITDACFSGAIFKTRGVEELRTASFDTQQLYRLRSRRAITSGTLQVVPDESPFIKYLVQFLEENSDKFLSSGELFTRMRKSVMNNGITVPQDGVIMNTGDEGGDFIFIKKEVEDDSKTFYKVKGFDSTPTTKNSLKGTSLLPNGSSSLGSGKFINIDGVNFYYEEYGKGDTILLLHGNSESIKSFNKQIPELSKEFHLIAMDSRGQGNSSKDVKRMSYQLMAQDVNSFLEKLNIKRVNLLGWSDGGNIGLILAMEHPEKVKRLATMGANLFNDNTSVDEKINKEIRTQREKLVKQGTERNKFEIEMIDLLLNEPKINPEELKKIQCPTLVMAGSNDVIKEGHTKLIASKIEKSKLTIFDKGTHYEPSENPNRFNKTVREFFKEK